MAYIKKSPFLLCLAYLKNWVNVFFFFLFFNPRTLTILYCNYLFYICQVGFLEIFPSAISRLYIYNNNLWSVNIILKQKRTIQVTPGICYWNKHGNAFVFHLSVREKNWVLFTFNTYNSIINWQYFLYCYLFEVLFWPQERIISL